MSPSWSEAVRTILELVSTRTGWEFPPTRWLSAEVTVRQTMDQTGTSQIADFIGRLRRDDQALDELIERLSIYESYFFRDRKHFQLLRQDWAQEMLALHGQNRLCRLWSAGCASGEEPYSLAILIKELGWTARTHILATDLSRSALALARQGIYAKWSLRQSDPDFVSAYFRRTADGRHELDARIRDMVTFKHLNLNSASYPAADNGTQGLHLILFRNVAIYLSQRTLSQVSHRLFASLAEGGWLILGPSDPVLIEYAPFELCEINGILVHKRPAAAALRVLPPAQWAPTAASAAPGEPTFAEPASEPEEEDERSKLVLQVRALADNNRFAAAESAVLAALARYPVAPEFIFLHLIILLGLQRHEEAAQLAGQLIFLDRQLAIAHFFRGTSLQATGDVEGARRAFENALRICAERPAHERVAFSEGESHVRLGQAAASQLAQLNRRGGENQKVQR